MLPFAEHCSADLEGLCAVFLKDGAAALKRAVSRRGGCAVAPEEKQSDMTSVRTMPRGEDEWAE